MHYFFRRNSPCWRTEGQSRTAAIQRIPEKKKTPSKRAETSTERERTPSGWSWAISSSTPPLRQIPRFRIQKWSSLASRKPRTSCPASCLRCCKPRRPKVRPATANWLNELAEKRVELTAKVLMVVSLTMCGLEWRWPGRPDVIYHQVVWDSFLRTLFRPFQIERPWPCVVLVENATTVKITSKVDDIWAELESSGRDLWLIKGEINGEKLFWNLAAASLVDCNYS